MPDIDDIWDDDEDREMVASRMTQRGFRMGSQKMSPREQEEAAILAKRGGENLPLAHMPAAWDGHRSVRIYAGGVDRGLATTAYSYALTDAEKVSAAARISALWNLAAQLGWSTHQINQMVATKTGPT